MNKTQTARKETLWPTGQCCCSLELVRSVYVRPYACTGVEKEHLLCFKCNGSHYVLSWGNCNLIHIFLMLGIESRLLHMVSTCSNTELQLLALLTIYQSGAGGREQSWKCVRHTHQQQQHKTVNLAERETWMTGCSEQSQELRSYCPKLSQIKKRRPHRPIFLEVKKG